MEILEKNTKVESVPSWTWMLLVAICLLIFIIGWVSSCNTTSSTSSATENIADNLKNSREVLKLMFDNYTPCNVPINYKFELDTQGDPISLKFPGIDKIIYYSGKGTIKVPPRKSGKVEILSLNPNMRVRVRIWKVIGY